MRYLQLHVIYMSVLACTDSVFPENSECLYVFVLLLYPPQSVFSTHTILMWFKLASTEH